jgi:hypothetical protein
MEMFQVGRPAIREAMQTLSHMGLVSITHGERARVTPITAAKLIGQVGESAKHFLANAPENLEHLKEARVFFEVGMVRLATERASDADIARQYRADAQKYAATEKRTITQVVVLDQAGATALAAKVKAGTPLAAAATAAGLSPSTQPALAKPALAGQTSPALADAVFAGRQGDVVGPVRGGLGFIVARVDKVEQVAGKTTLENETRVGVVALTAVAADRMPTRSVALNPARACARAN